MKIAKHNPTLGLLALCLGFFIVILDGTIVNVSLPSLARYFSSSLAGLQWVIDSYTLMFAGLLLSAGHIADQFGAKRGFIIGLGIFIITSLCCGLAPNLTCLIIFRFLQGIGAALLVPTSVALINGLYTEPHAHAKALGVWGSMGGLAAVCGPFFGGILTAWLGWRAIFLVNIPVGIVAIWSTAQYVGNVLPKKLNSGMDFPGQFLCILSMGSLAFSLIEAGEHSFFSITVITGLVIFLVSFILFLIRERSTVAPMLPLNLFEWPTFSISIVIGFILSFSFYGLLFVLPLYFEQIRAYTVLMTGFALTPLFILAALSSYMTGKIIHWLSPKVLMSGGLLLASIGFFSLISLQQDTPSYWVMVFPFLLLSFSLPIVVVATTIVVVKAVPEGRAGIASAAFNASRQFGSLLGVAIFGALVNAARSFIFGMHWGVILAGIACLIGACLSIWVVWK